MKGDVFKRVYLPLSLVVERTRAGVSTTMLIRSWRLSKTSQYYISELSPAAIALLMIIIITSATILQPALATANLPSNNTTSTPKKVVPPPHTEYNSVTLGPSNQ